MLGGCPKCVMKVCAHMWGWGELQNILGGFSVLGCNFFFLQMCSLKCKKKGTRPLSLDLPTGGSSDPDLIGQCQGSFAFQPRLPFTSLASRVNSKVNRLVYRLRDPLAAAAGTLVAPWDYYILIYIRLSSLEILSPFAL